MLGFDAATTRLLDDAYQGTDVVRRRLANLRALDPAPGDTVLDIGAGNGLLTLELSRAVGEAGRVIAIDPSPDMRASATERCAERANVEIVDGVVGALPVDDDAADGAVAVQVFEYLDDIPAALAEVARALRPGGRVAIGDMHWGTHAWHSAEPARMDRMLRAWGRHLVEPCVPAVLPRLMADAGFTDIRVTPEMFTDTTLRADGLAMMMLRLIEAYVTQNDLAEPDEVGAWADEQHRLAAEGRFFFAIAHFVVSARLGPH